MAEGDFPVFKDAAGRRVVVPEYLRAILSDDEIAAGLQSAVGGVWIREDRDE